MNTSGGTRANLFKDIFVTSLLAVDEQDCFGGSVAVYIRKGKAQDTLLKNKNKKPAEGASWLD